MTATVESNKGIAVAAFRPITWSIKDTRQTINEIKIHNEVGAKLGFWTAPPDKAVRGWAKIKARFKHWPIKKANAVAPGPIQPPSPAATVAVPVPATLATTPATETKPATKPTLLQRIRIKLHRKPKPLP